MELSNPIYDSYMTDLCKYIKNVLVPNGQQSIDYLVKKLDLPRIGLNRYQLYISYREVNFCIRFINDVYAKSLIYLYMLKKES